MLVAALMAALFPSDMAVAALSSGDCFRFDSAVVYPSLGRGRFLVSSVGDTHPRRLPVKEKSPEEFTAARARVIPPSPDPGTNFPSFPAGSLFKFIDKTIDEEDKRIDKEVEKAIDKEDEGKM